jgi:hypothetical protein
VEVRGLTKKPISWWTTPKLRPYPRLKICRWMKWKQRRIQNLPILALPLPM